MYEGYLSATKNGVTDIDISVDDTVYWGGVEGDWGAVTDPSAVSVKISFAVATDEEAWVTIDGNGDINPSFGGTGLSDREMREYMQQAVDIWSAITGEETSCRLTRRISPQ